MSKAKLCFWVVEVGVGWASSLFHELKTASSFVSRHKKSANFMEVALFSLKRLMINVRLSSTLFSVGSQ